MKAERSELIDARRVTADAQINTTTNVATVPAWVVEAQEVPDAKLMGMGECFTLAIPLFERQR